MSDQDKKAKALEMIKAVVDDGCAEINGREYKFSRTVHKKRRKVFAFYTKVASQIESGNFGFLDSDEWDSIESLIADIVLFDGMQLSKQEDHWEKYPEDYMSFIGTVLPVISFPFFGASGGN
jgi:hypothetical protein